MTSAPHALIARVGRERLRIRSPERSRVEPNASEDRGRGAPSPELAEILCALVRIAIDAVTDLRPVDLGTTFGPSPRGLQHRRQVGMYLAHVAFGVRTQDVARIFKRDTTTVYYAYRQIEDMRDDKGIDAFLDAIEALVASVYTIASDTAEASKANGEDVKSVSP